jgi:hypothetical protein
MHAPDAKALFMGLGYDAPQARQDTLATRV